MKIRRLGMAVLSACALAAPGTAQARESGYLVSVQESKTDAIGYVYFGPAKIMRLNEAGKPMATLTDSAVGDYDPKLAPDETVYFTRYFGGYVWAYQAGFVPVSGQGDIWRMKLDGTGVEALTTTPQWDEWAPAISEDGRYMVWERYDVPNFTYSDLVVRDLETGQDTVIARGDWSYLTSASFTPDGKKIVFVQEKDKLHEFAIANLDGSERKTIYRAKAGAHNAEVSPDGTRIVFDKYDDPDGERNNLAVIDIDGSNEHQLTEGKAYQWAPTWSPDASEVLFTHNDLAGNSRLMKLAPNGAKPRRFSVMSEWALASTWFGSRPSIFPAPPTWAASLSAGPVPAPAAPPRSPLALKTGKARTDRSGRVAMRLACVAKAPCRGRVALVVQNAGPPRVVASAKVSLKAGRGATVRLKLNSAGRRLLKSRRSLSVRADFLVGKRAYRAGTLQLRGR